MFVYTVYMQYIVICKCMQVYMYGMYTRILLCISFQSNMRGKIENRYVYICFSSEDFILRRQLPYIVYRDI